MTGMEPLIVAGASAAASALSPLAGKAAEKAAEKLGEIFMQFALEQGGKKFLGVFGKSADAVENAVFGAEVCGELWGAAWHFEGAGDAGAGEFGSGLYGGAVFG
jgi:hypothetical protein